MPEDISDDDVRHLVPLSEEGGKDSVGHGQGESRASSDEDDDSHIRTRLDAPSHVESPPALQPLHSTPSLPPFSASELTQL